MMPPLLLGALLFGLSACRPAEAESPLQDGDSVLFLGNSKIGSEGGLHNHVRRTAAKATPSLRIETAWFNAYGAQSVADLLTDEAKARLRSGNDKLVVLQSGEPEGMKQVAALCREANRPLAILMAWPDQYRSIDTFRREVAASLPVVQQVATETGAKVIPSGLLYYDLLAAPPAKGLREDWLFVPGSAVQNDLGTLVNVAATYAVATGRSPVGLPCWEPFPTELVEAIEARVWQVVQDWQAGHAELRPLPDTTLSEAQRVPASEAASWPAVIGDGQSLYYVGNSFIGTEGGLDNHFRRMLAITTPPWQLRNRCDIFWGQPLDRMATNAVMRQIAEGKHDLVVVTSGNVEVLNRFKTAIDAADSKMAVHMTWGRNPTINQGGVAAFREQTIQIVDSMKAFEKANGVPVVPCGLVFYDLVTDPPKIPGLRTDFVFMPENIHQGQLGSFVNLATHYAMLCGRSPVGLPHWDPYPPELTQAVTERAWQIVQDWKSDRITFKPAG